MLSAAFPHSSSSYLTPQMEARSGQDPSLSLSLKYIVFFNVVWLLAHCLRPNLLIFLSALLYLSVWQTPPTPDGKHQHEIIPLSLLYILFREHCQYLH